MTARRLFLLTTLSSLLLSGPTLARDLTDAMGPVEVPEAPAQIVVLTNEGTEALLALGVIPVGAANSWNGDPWWDHISDQMGDATPVGKESAINLELVAALEPDLILGNKQRHEEIHPQLSAIAPTVFSEELRGDWKINFRTYAEALGMTERAENQNVPEFAIRTGKESIPDMDGDRIFWFTWEPGEGDALADDVLSDSLWQSLSAVQAGRVHGVSDAIWNSAGGILAARLMLEDVARIYGVE